MHSTWSSSGWVGVFDNFFSEIRQATSSLHVWHWVLRIKCQILSFKPWGLKLEWLSMCSISCYIDSISRSTIHWLKTKSKICFLNSLLYWHLWKSQKWFIFQRRWSSSARLHWSFRRRLFLAAYPQGFSVGTFKLQHCLQWWSGNRNMTGLEKTKLNFSLFFG